MTTQIDIANQALEFIGNQASITTFNDGSAAANAATVLYTPTVQIVLRELDPAFARRTAVLVAAIGIVAPIPPWTQEYVYPADCVRLRSLRPAVGEYDPEDPQPLTWQVAFDAIGSPAAAGKVIVTDLVHALAVYTSSTPTENQWDSTFTDAVVRRLANPFAMALAGRPDFARELLEEAARSAAVADAVDET